MCWSCRVLRSDWVCVSCRRVKSSGSVCELCGKSMISAPPDWAAPKKNDDRAWKRVEAGEWNWNRRRVRRAKYRHATFDFKPPVNGASKYACHQYYRVGEGRDANFGAS